MRARKPRRQQRLCLSSCSSLDLDAPKDHAAGRVAAVERLKLIGERVFAHERSDPRPDMFSPVEVVDAAERYLVDRQDASVKGGLVVMQFGLGYPLRPQE